MTTAPDYAYAPDFWASMAIRETLNTYGDQVSLLAKNKTLAKFGRTRNADQNVLQEVADLQGDTRLLEIPTTNAVDTIVSTSANDDQVIRLEGHTADGNGLLTFVVQDVTLEGQTEVPLGTPLRDCTRGLVKDGTFASPATALEGVVSVFDNADGSAAGVPNTAADVHLRIRGDLGINQSEKAATSISDADYFFITEANAGVARGGTAAADVDIEVRRIGGVWRPVGMEVAVSASSPFAHIPFRPWIIVPRNSDIRMVATASANNTTCLGRIEGVLAKVI